jgi:predicted nucleotidyltransferase
MAKLPSKVRDVIVELEKRLKELYGDRFRGLLLFGSYARGTAWEGSDVDLLLLWRGPVDAVREILNVQPVKNPLSLESDLVLSVVPASIEDFERGETMFLRVIRREAIPAAA